MVSRAPSGARAQRFLSASQPAGCAPLPPRPPSRTRGRGAEAPPGAFSGRGERSPGRRLGLGGPASAFRGARLRAPASLPAGRASAAAEPRPGSRPPRAVPPARAARGADGDGPRKRAAQRPGPPCLRAAVVAPALRGKGLGGCDSGGGDWPRTWAPSAVLPASRFSESAHAGCPSFPVYFFILLLRLNGVGDTSSQSSVSYCKKKPIENQLLRPLLTAFPLSDRTAWKMSAFSPSPVRSLSGGTRGAKGWNF